MKDEITQELFETIEQYLLGGMNDAQKAEFEKAIAGDDHLAQKVEEFRILFAGAEEAVLKEKLNIFHSDLQGQENPAKVRSLPFLRYFIAASVALLVLLGSWWLIRQNDPNEKLFTEFFQPDPGLPTTMGVNKAYEFSRGMVDYKSGDYEAAILKWEPLQKQYPGNDTLGFFLGVSHLAVNHPDKAIPYLQLVIDKSDSAFRNEAFWYQGLSFLREDNIEEARKSIEASSHPRKDALLSNLK